MSSHDLPAGETAAATNQNPKALRLGFDNTYARLPERFYARVNPVPVAAPRLIQLNVPLALSLGLDADLLASPEGVQVLAGNRVAEDSKPIAIAYAGHQFGQFVPQLGDGRANLLGEVIAHDGLRYDIQLKGSGRTPFSRGGDGRAALGPVLREYILSESMAALGVPTTRALAALTTGQQVLREEPMPGAIFVRVAASHLRVGTFQYFAARADTDAIRILADYAIARHYPAAAASDRPIHALLRRVAVSQAKLVAQWMLLGFVHGVMNTDNTSISGETIDYGPCAFMEAYDPHAVFSSIDYRGRYAYSNQVHAMHWNVTRLAETLLPILEQETGSKDGAIESAQDALASFAPEFEAARRIGFRRKLGLRTEQDGDDQLAETLLEAMAANQVDFTSAFRGLTAAAAGDSADPAMRALFLNPDAYDQWAAQWRSRLQHEAISADARAAAMRLANPAFIPRNHLVQAVIDAAVERQDYQPFEELLDATSRPYEDRPGFEHFATPARPEECVIQTFCGT